jgi:CRISPR-associated protein Csd2
MSILQNKIDFAAIISVHHANPNGDPLNGNRPRESYEGIGEISDVCIKRKIRNRLIDAGYPVFVQSDDKRVDEFTNLRDRANSVPELRESGKDRDLYAKVACKTWIDVRSFGQVFAFKGKKEGEEVSVGVRGTVSIHPAFSVAPIDIVSLQITKSVNSEKDGDKKASDTMGMKHRVERGIYVLYGSINCQLCEKTGFSEEDAEAIKNAICTLFVNDSSSARPEGSMEVREVYWWKHNCKSGQYSSAKVHGSLKVSLSDVEPYYTVNLQPLEGLKPEVYEGV